MVKSRKKRDESFNHMLVQAQHENLDPFGINLPFIYHLLPFIYYIQGLVNKIVNKMHLNV